MTSVPGPRSRQQRIRDVELRLDQDIDAWVATGDPVTGEPFLAPFSLLWDGSTLLFATAATARTTRNLQANPVARVALGAPS